MSLSQDLKNWQERFAALLAEGQELLEQIEEREKQNVALEESLGSAQGEGGGLEALDKLYEEGFHICHARFAQVREEECLFCRSFLLSGGVNMAPDQPKDD